MDHQKKYKILDKPIRASVCVKLGENDFFSFAGELIIISMKKKATFFFHFVSHVGKKKFY